MRKIISDYFKRRALWRLFEYYHSESLQNGKLSTYAEDKEMKLYCIKLKLNFDQKKQEILNKIESL